MTSHIKLRAKRKVEIMTPIQVGNFTVGCRLQETEVPDPRYVVTISDGHNTNEVALSLVASLMGAMTSAYGEATKENFALARRGMDKMIKWQKDPNRPGSYQYAILPNHRAEVQTTPGLDTWNSTRPIWMALMDGKVLAENLPNRKAAQQVVEDWVLINL